jgi:hypothetical protein
VVEAEQALAKAMESGDEVLIAQAQADLNREKREAMEAQEDAERERREADEAAALMRQEELKFKMGQSMAANMHDRKADALTAQGQDAMMEMMAHDMGEDATAAGKKADAKRTKLELAEAAEREALMDHRTDKQKAKAAKKERKMQARQELMVRMQTAAAVMVQVRNVLYVGTIFDCLYGVA